MRIGNAAWGLRETPLRRQLEMTAEMGLELLELSIAGYNKDFLQLDATPAQKREVLKMFGECGLKPECACTGNDFTGNDVPAQVEKVRKVIDIAADLGIGYLRIFAGFSSDSVVFGERFDHMIAALKEVAVHSAKRQVIPVVETHGGVAENNGALVHFASVTTRSDHWRLILETGVSINYDPANLAAVGALDPISFYHDFHHQIKYMHLKDFRSVPGGVVPVACGEGRLDWKKLMHAINGFSGPALIEYELPGDVEDGLKRSLKFLNQWRTS